jgi:hypothetical protein
LFTLWLNFDEDDGALSEKKGMGHLKEMHHLKREGGGKTTIRAYACNKCLA